MSTKIDWKGIENALTLFAQILSETSTSLKKEQSLPAESTSNVLGIIGKASPLLQLPYEIRDNITTEFYELGRTSMMQNYVEEKVSDNAERMQKLFTDLYHYAVRIDSHVLAWNTMVVLSQVPYAKLGSWADMLAVAATRNPYLDIKEMGIRCFENWEDIGACSFLEGCAFSEQWLQEYANEVCAYVKEEGLTTNVLSQENYPWKMARRRDDNSSNSERYSGGYSSSRIQN